MPTSQLGFGLAILSAASFATSGPFGDALFAAGWSPAAAITARVLLAAAALAVPALFALHGKWHLVRTNAARLVAYGLLAITVAQLCFFNAITHLPVGVALLLEYSGVLLVVGWMWLRHGQRPGRVTLAGVTVAIVGLLFVLDVRQAGGISLVGVLWGLGAAVGLAAYYVLSAQVDPELPPVAMAWTGMIVGGLALLVAGLIGLAPLHASTHQVTLLHHRMSWLVPVLGVSLLAAAFAYAAGIGAARRLGARLSSFAGLTEVLFAVLFAWLLLGQLPTTSQLFGGVLVVTGVALVKAGEPSGSPELNTVVPELV
ncbi:MAG TPA: DMT family transporter [Jatrophihabitans sp.]|nr:DMT family transporter [Jatrophihabitans sp.]